MPDDQFYKQKYFEDLTDRISSLEGKIDYLTKKVTWIYAWSAGFATLAAFVIDYFLRKGKY